MSGYRDLRLNQDTAITAPSSDTLSDHDYDNPKNEDNVDFSDLEAQYDLQMEEGLDTFVVIGDLPIVNEAQEPKLVKFVLKKFHGVGRTKSCQHIAILRARACSSMKPTTHLVHNHTLVLSEDPRHPRSELIEIAWAISALGCDSWKASMSAKDT